MLRLGLRTTRALPTPLFRGFKTIPQPPGNIVGTVNDAYVAPPPDKKHGSWHWTLERVVAIGLVPLVGASFTLGLTAVLDTTLLAALLVHCYTGFQSCIIDYIPTRVYGAYHNYAMYLLTFGSGVAAYGIYDMEKREEGGLTGVVSRIFKA